MKKQFLATLCAGLCLFSVEAQDVLPYQNANLSPAERAEDLLHRLTLKEKVSLMKNGSAAVDRLGIPAYDWWNEALHGVGRAGLATVFPQTIGMAATFDDQAVYETFDIVSDEARAKHHRFKNSQDQLKRYQGLILLDAQHQHLPRPALGTRPGDLRRRSLPHRTHGRSRRSGSARRH